MKLYPLLLGRTKVPFGQFYGGLKGWEGLGALFRFVTDKKHFIWVPIHGYLLEHPSAGLILFDAGWRQVTRFAGYSLEARDGAATLR